MEKKIIIDEKRKFLYEILDNCYVASRRIREGIVDGDEINSYSLFQSDDYAFSGYTEDENIDELVFTYDENHPLYLPYIHLLKDDDSIIIEDDLTREYDKKYLKIYKENNIIYLKFCNKLDNIKKYDIDKFNIFVKNIVYDIRSKIDCDGKDTKERLSKFFNEVEEKVTEEYHQITLDEYSNKKMVYKMSK